MKKLDNDSSRKKILLRIDSELYNQLIKQSTSQDKSTTLLINEILWRNINNYERCNKRNDK